MVWALMEVPAIIRPAGAGAMRRVALLVESRLENQPVDPVAASTLGGAGNE